MIRAVSRLDLINALNRADAVKAAIDFETSSKTPIKVTGMGPYFESPDFQVLMLGVAVLMRNGDILHAAFGVEPDYHLFRSALQALIHFRTPTYAHNSEFEMATLARLEAASPEALKGASELLILDTAVLARIYGAHSKLEWAGLQLTDQAKLTTSGKRFIDTFCLGQELTPEYLREHLHIWSEGLEYVANDAVVSLVIARDYDDLSWDEWENFKITSLMNRNGWKVDTDLLDRMKVQSEHNSAMTLSAWHDTYKPLNARGEPLNIKSWQQVKHYIEARGFDCPATDKITLAKIRKRAERRLAGRTTPIDVLNSEEVIALIDTKAELGGSSLSKLEAIRNRLCQDNRIRYQYVHAGAGQTFRTSGVGVQMQNLKRLGKGVIDLADVSRLSNTQLADNLRQLFTAESEYDSLTVCDLSGIEARVLAWVAGEQWKLDAIKEGLDLYKLLAMDLFYVGYDQISPEQRSDGKVGELGGGYGMGGPALQSYAEKMGVDRTEEQCVQIIGTYRKKNQKIVNLWYMLNDAVIHALRDTQRIDVRTLSLGVPEGSCEVTFTARPETPQLDAVMAGTQQLRMDVKIFDDGGVRVHEFFRIWRGAYLSQGKFGTEVTYHRTPVSPSKHKLWVDHSIDSDTQEKYTNKLYGGRLTGILIQSIAREIFFFMLKEINMNMPGLKMVGQFHDEVVIEVRAPSHSQAVMGAQIRLEDLMSTSPSSELPISSSASSDYRYIK